MKEKILHMLLRSHTYVSGEELSKELSITRSAIWKYIKALKEEGYTIDSVTNKGYRLTSTDQAFNAYELEKELNTVILGKEAIFLKAVDSTNEEIKRQAKKDADHGLIVIAEEQTSGKGRLGKLWSSEKGSGLWFSILLRPDLDPSHVPGITLAAGLGVCKAIRSFTGCNAQIKWPNDIIVGNKKICGILTEMTAEADRIDHAVVGIGINVNNVSFPAELSEKATSLRIETGEFVSRTKLLQTILYELEIQLDEYMLNPQASFLSDYYELCATLGRTVTVIRNGKEYVGVAKDIGANGALMVKTESGETLAVTSGEVAVQGIY